MGKIHAIPAGDDGEREKDRSQNRHQLHGFILFVIGLRLFKIPQGLAVINRLLRYLLESKQVAFGGEWKTFREMPWGEMYIKPYTGRVLTRAAF